MKYILSIILILSLITGCKTAKKVSVTKTKTEAVSVRNERQIGLVEVDSSVQNLGIDTYHIETIIEYTTDAKGKTVPVKKTIKKSGVKTDAKNSKHSTIAAAEVVNQDSVAIKTETYIKNKDVKRNSNMTGIVIAIIAVAIFLIIKMIRMK